MQDFKPLAGTRVLSFEGFVSLPTATRLLADLGADVIRIPLPSRRGNYAPFEQFVENADLLINKASLRLDLKTNKGQDLARRLASTADIVCDNFRPNVMEKFGLGPNSLRELRSDLIILKLSGYGTPGPWSEYPTLGPSVEAAGGMNMLIGSDDSPPMRIGTDIYADLAAGRYAVIAILDALNRRDETGEGSFIDLSMYETVVHLIGDKVVGSAESGAAHPRLGNRSRFNAPQGIYPTAGKDDWVAISVMDDAQWAALKSVVGRKELGRAELDCLQGRLEAHDEIDTAIAQWTSSRTKLEVAEVLQRAGVAAGPVQRPMDIPDDPQYKARGFFRSVLSSESVADQRRKHHMGTPWRSPGFEPVPLKRMDFDGVGGPRALKEWLGLSDAVLSSLAESGVVLPAAAMTTKAEESA